MADWLPKLFYSPAEIASYLQELDIAFAGFFADLGLAQGVFNADEMEQMGMLDENYHIWLAGLHFWDYGAAATVHAGERYALQLKYWIDQFQKRTGNKLTGPGVSLLVPGNVHEPLFAANFSGTDIISKEQSDKLQTMVVAICVAVGLSAIARTLRG